jgi:hypothetical protein
MGICVAKFRFPNKTAGFSQNILILGVDEIIKYQIRIRPEKIGLRTIRCTHQKSTCSKVEMEIVVLDPLGLQESSRYAT